MVIAIIAVLAGLVFAVMGKSRERADVVRCTNNLRQIGTALSTYAGENGGALPPNVEEQSQGEVNESVWSARLVSRHYLTEPSDLKNAIFLCPFDPGAKDPYAEAYRSYAYNPGSTDELKPTYLASVENPASTILLAEWFEPDPDASPDQHAVWDSQGWSIRINGGLYKHHPGGRSGVLFYDFHVESVPACASLPSPDVPYKWTLEAK